MSEPYLVHGLDLSYFTGKIEAYMRAKGIAYRLVEMDMRDFRACARATGVLQMPQIETPDGHWLTDTTQIIAYLEQYHPNPRISPSDKAAHFASMLLEEFGDEALWRPALYYRWVFHADARLMSERIARGMLRDAPAPLWLRRRIILARQKRTFLDQDGVRVETRPAIEALYTQTLAAMETALAHKPFLLGQRPCEADFGFFGAMFRHFFCDPTPGKIMRETAPRVLAWVARLWALSPAQFADAPEIEALPQTGDSLGQLIARSLLPYLQANEAAYVAGAGVVSFEDFGARFQTPVAPYRVWSFGRLKQSFRALPQSGKDRLVEWLGAHACATLSGNIIANAPGPPALPIEKGTARSQFRDRMLNRQRLARQSTARS